MPQFETYRELKELFEEHGSKLVRFVTKTGETIPKEDVHLSGRKLERSKVEFVCA